MDKYGIRSFGLPACVGPFPLAAPAYQLSHCVGATSGSAQGQCPLLGEPELCLRSQTQLNTLCSVINYLQNPSAKSYSYSTKTNCVCACLWMCACVRERELVEYCWMHLHICEW